LKFLDRLLGKQAEPIVLSGGNELEVVGESFYVDSFDRIARKHGADRGIQVVAVLEAEPNNQYDPNAVAVKVDGLKVGHLDRKIAARFQPAVIRLTKEHGQPIGLRGVIGRGHGPDGFYSITLDHNPSDFA